MITYHKWFNTEKLVFMFYSEGRTNLIGNHPLGMDGNRPVTFLSIDPEGETGSNTRSSTSNIGGEDGRIDLLQDSSNNETLSLAADCIARLAHTRAGECKSGEVKELKVMHGHCYWSHNCHYDS